MLVMQHSVCMRYESTAQCTYALREYSTVYVCVTGVQHSVYMLHGGTAQFSSSSYICLNCSTNETVAWQKMTHVYREISSGLFKHSG